MTHRRRRRSGLRSAAALIVASLLGAMSAGMLSAGSARADASYAASARTQTFTGTISNPSIPTGIDIEGGGPEAEVKQSSLNVRDASAQLPYAGDTFPGLPGTGGALFNFPVPPYPFIASSTAGSPPQTVSYPGVTLHAESTDFTTAASSTAGQPGSGATAAAKVSETREGGVTALASTAADTVALGPYVVLSDVRSSATVAADANGKLTRTFSSSIGRISVPGLALDIPRSSPGQIPIPVPIPGVPNQPPVNVPVYPYPAGGQTLHDPNIGVQDGYFTITEVVGGKRQTYLLPSEPALAAFQSAGVTIRFQAPQVTPTGVVSGAYIFEYTIPAPPQNGYWNGPTRISQATAYSQAAVDLAAPPAAPVAPASPAQAAPAAPVVAAAPTAPIASVGLPPVVAAAAVPVVAGAPVLPTRGLLVAQPAAEVAGIKVGHGIDGPYLAITGLGLLGALTAVGVRVVGGR